MILYYSTQIENVNENRRSKTFSKNSILQVILYKYIQSILHAVRNVRIIFTLFSNVKSLCASTLQ
jgi:hypothetical protein